MAEVRTSLIIDSRQYESQVARASAAIQQLGSSFLTAGEKTQNMVAALGNMQTVSKSASGQASELRRAIKELTVQYSQLTDAEKQTDAAQNLASSLDTLKARYKELVAPMQEVDKELSGTGDKTDGLGGSLSSLASKFGINVKSLTAWGAALTAGKMALDVAKDAFFASEKNLDDWERTVYTCQSVYDSFLISLNTSDFSGFLNRIDDIKQAAEDAYDELDRLGTLEIINNPKVQSQSVENERMRNMLRTGRYIAPSDGTAPASGMNTGDILTKEQLQNISNHLKDGMASLTNLLTDDVEQVNNTINALYKEQAARLGMTKEQFLSGIRDMSTFERYVSGASKYNSFEREHTTQTLVFNGAGRFEYRDIRDDVRNPYQQYRGWDVFREDGELFKQINNLINKRAGLQSQLYGQIAQGYRNINRVEGVSTSHTPSNRQSSSVADPVIVPLRFEELDFTKIKTGLSESISDLKRLKATWDETFNNANDPLTMLVAKDKIDEITAKIEDLRNNNPFAIKGFSLDDIKLPGELQNLRTEKKDEQKSKKSSESIIDNVSSALGGLTQIANGLKNVGIDLGTGFDTAISVVQGVIQVIEGVQTVISIFGTTSLTANTAALIANTTALYANAAVDFLPFSEGGALPAAANGIIAGNHYHGDTRTIRVNDGEMIINQTDQAKLYNALHGDSLQFGGGNRTDVVRGSNLYLCLRNYMMESGRRFPA